MVFLGACSPADLLEADMEQHQEVTMVDTFAETTGPDLMADFRPDDSVDETVTDLVFEIPADETSGPLCQPGEGCFLDPCSDSDDCQSGWCVGHLGEDVCTIQCQSECPPGWNCQQVPDTAPDVVFICISSHANLCLPCATGGDCKGTAGADNVCVDYEDEGSFCGGTCSTDEECPWGFSCTITMTVDDVETTQCVADAGQCPCAEKAVELALWTPCEVANSDGICTGKRICTDAGLTDCDAAIPEPETCDGSDNNCNGDVDDGMFIDGEYLSLCNDGNPCTTDQCNGEQGCEYIALTEGECMDGNPCTVADHCVDGVCTGDPVQCDDENPCTDDLCTESGGCNYPPIAGDCDDNDPCTLGDHCTAGECGGEPVACSCSQDSDCTALEDGDVCNGTLVCAMDTIPYQCVIDPTTVITCLPPSGPDSPCLAASCDPMTGQCGLLATNNSSPCEDGDLCSLGDTCVEGSCQAGSSVNCNDGNTCTDDSCESAIGCLNTANTAPCSDNNVCTNDDICDAGACQSGMPLNCDDGNQCNGLESCEPLTGCSAGKPLVCDDGNPCNGVESCTSEGGCQPGLPLSCDDGNVCTDETCSPETGCVNTANQAACDDGNACTLGDICQNKACVADGGLLNCDDSNPCTSDSCDPGIGCLHVLNEAACNDGDICTVNDHCHLGQCLGGGDLTCNDNNPCTTDSCKPDSGCQFTPAQAECDDGSKCSSGDHCSNGLCIATSFINCDDSNPCTDDSCSPETGCVNAPNQAPCNDSNPCTTIDLCTNGDCEGTGLLDCDDSNPCTDDLCLEGAGCSHVNNTIECDDNDKCTPFDQCTEGICKGTGAVTCDDLNICTDEVCEPLSGCVITNNEALCNDNNVCTVDDTCKDGACKPGEPLDCSDNIECTIDTCDTVQGCLHELGDNCCGNGILDPGEGCDDGNQNDNDYCSNSCEFTGSVHSQYDKEGRTVYIFKSVSELPLTTYNQFCESLGLTWFVPKSSADAKHLISYCYSLDSHHTWIITKTNTSGDTFGGFDVSSATNGGGCSGDVCSDSGFSAIRQWSSSYCNPEKYGKTECWDTDHTYDWLVCEGN
jgi:hypothetical protein